MRELLPWKKIVCHGRKWFTRSAIVADNSITIAFQIGIVHHHSRMQAKTGQQNEKKGQPNYKLIWPGPNCSSIEEFYW